MIALYTDTTLRLECNRSTDMPGIAESSLITQARYDMENKLKEHPGRYPLIFPHESDLRGWRITVKIKAMLFEFARYRESRRTHDGLYSFTVTHTILGQTLFGPTLSAERGFVEINLSLRPCITEESDVLGLGIVHNEILHWRPF